MSVLQEKNRNLAYVSVSLAETATKFCVFGPTTTATPFVLLPTAGNALRLWM